MTRGFRPIRIGTGLFGLERRPESRASIRVAHSHLLPADHKRRLRRFHGEGYGTSGAGRSPVVRIRFRSEDGLPGDIPVPGPSQGFIFLLFHYVVDGTPDQLLVGTSEGVDRVEGDRLVPTIPALRRPGDATFDVEVSRNPLRVYAGHSDGVSSMRWDGHAWIDEGRLPHVVFPAREAHEDNDGYLWASGAIGRVMRIRVAPTGLGNSTYEVLGAGSGPSRWPRAGLR